MFLLKAGKPMTSTKKCKHAWCLPNIKKHASFYLTVRVLFRWKRNMWTGSPCCDLRQVGDDNLRRMMQKEDENQTIWFFTLYSHLLKKRCYRRWKSTNRCPESKRAQSDSPYSHAKPVLPAPGPSPTRVPWWKAKEDQQIEPVRTTRVCIRIPLTFSVSGNGAPDWSLYGSHDWSIVIRLIIVFDQAHIKFQTAFIHRTKTTKTQRMKALDPWNAKARERAHERLKFQRVADFKYKNLNPCKIQRRPHKIISERLHIQWLRLGNFVRVNPGWNSILQLLELEASRSDWFPQRHYLAKP